MTTIESNKLIAEFMGYKSNKSEHYKIPNNIWLNHRATDSYVMHHSSNLCFDKEWAWLMPVVEKIESLGYVSTIEKMNTEYDSHRVWFNRKGSLEEVARGARDESKFVAIYMAVEDFIIWYNKQK